MQNIRRNIVETENLKGLALLVLERNRVRNKTETDDKISVSLPRNKDTCSIKYFYEERVAIYQYEAGYSETEAEILAFKDTMLEYSLDHYPAIVAEVEKIVFNQTIN